MNSPALCLCRFSFFTTFLCFLGFLRPFGTLAALKTEQPLEREKLETERQQEAEEPEALDLMD